MSQLDRLSSLVSHFEISAKSVQDVSEANLIVLGNDDGPESVWLSFARSHIPDCKLTVLAMAQIDYGGSANPVLDALPKEITINLRAETELAALSQLLASEINIPRCGGQIALDRLCEFLRLSMLLKQIEARPSETGLLAGLGDPNIYPVLVAIHDQPGNAWKLDDFVSLSGQSRSQFMDMFQSTLGQSPMAYLKQWRMTLARNALINGARVKETARKFGYGSGDAFTRAFTQTYGVAPTKLNLMVQTG